MKKAKRTFKKVISFILHFLLFYWLFKTGQYKLAGLIVIAELIFLFMREVLRGVSKGLAIRAHRSRR